METTRPRRECPPQSRVPRPGRRTRPRRSKTACALAITPDGRTLLGAMQRPLLQDGGDVKGGVTRIVTFDLRTGATREFAYQLDPGVKTTISEIVAINDHDFLVDERDSKDLADNSSAAFKRLYRISLTGAVDVSHIRGAANLAPKALPKALFLDIVPALVANGTKVVDIPANLEGLAFGEDVTIGGVRKHTLYVSNDNDFSPVAVNDHGTTTGKPNRFFVVAFSDADLPGFVQQRFDRDDDTDRHDGKAGDDDGDRRDKDRRGGGSGRDDRRGGDRP